jgi:hypothetical protein
MSGPITLTSSTLAITKDVTIAGPGTGLIRVSGNNLFQIFNIAPGINVTISGLTIADGTSLSGDGDGIYNGGTLTVDDCILSNNSSGTFPNFNSGRGGGIYNAGMLTITGSTLSGNSAGAQSSSFSLSGSGGGIYNSGTLTVSDSTFSGNSAQAIRNDIRVDALRGGIYNSGTL